MQKPKKDEERELEECRNCKFHDERGKCHRYPPTSLLPKLITGSEEWCGEWKQENQLKRG